MLEIKDDEIDVDELMLRIRQEAEQRRITPGSSGAPDGALQGSYTSLSYGGDAPEPFTPDVQLPAGGHDKYHARELLKYYDREFIENAYRAVLKREPDESGLLKYLEGLRGGRFSRVDILYSLRSSVEGREKNVQIEGLYGHARLRRLYRLPIIGYLFEWMIELARLPLFIRGQRRFQAYSQTRGDRIVARLNLAVEENHRYFQKLSEEIDRHAEIAEKRGLAMSQQIEARARALSEEIQRLARTLDESFGARVRALDEKWEAGMGSLGEQLKAEAAGLRLEAATRSQATEEQLRSQGELLKAETERLAAEAQRLQAEALELLKAQKEEFGQSLQATRLKLQTTRTELVEQERRSLLLLEEARRLSSLAPSEKERAVIEEEGLHFLDAFYSSFEEHFRGSREEIIERLQVYLPVLEKAGITTDILDIGCGRGEWLEVLKSAGLRGRGIDINRVQVEWCQSFGLEAEEEEAIEYLRGLPDQSLMAVTGFHIVEHLEFDALLSLMNEIVRVLKPNGLVIFETPNPENVSVGSHNFYVDPTHRNPLPIPMMEFLFESRGLEPVEIIKLHPSETPRVEGATDLIERFNEYFYGPMDYAIIGHRA